MDPFKELNKNFHHVSEQERLKMAFEMYKSGVMIAITKDKKEEPDLEGIVDVSFTLTDLFLKRYQEKHYK